MLDTHSSQSSPKAKWDLAIHPSSLSHPEGSLLKAKENLRNASDSVSLSAS